jgi:TPR repeat protein
LISCISLPPATITSLPIFDFAQANEDLANVDLEHYYECCGKSICGGCVHSFRKSRNIETCAFCKANKRGKTELDRVEELKKRVEANDAVAMYMLAGHYYQGSGGLRQDLAKGVELWTEAAKLGSSQAHHFLGYFYKDGGNMKKAKIHYEAAAMAGHEGARYNLGNLEAESGNTERAAKHWIIAASAGYHKAMNNLLVYFKQGVVSRDTMNSTLEAYNRSCAEMRSEARGAYIRSRSN